MAASFFTSTCGCRKPGSARRSRVLAGSLSGHLMLLLAVSAPPWAGRVALPVWVGERGRDSCVASRVGGASAAGRSRGCTYSISLQIGRIRYAGEFVHPTGWGQPWRADRLLIRPASGRQASTGLSARTNHWKDTRERSHSQIERGRARPPAPAAPCRRDSVRRARAITGSACPQRARVARFGDA
jgi:hypothetical protein